MFCNHQNSKTRVIVTFGQQLEWTGVGKSFSEEERKALNGAKLPVKLRTDFQLSHERASSGASTKFPRSYRWALNEVNQVLREVNAELAAELALGGAEVRLLGEGA